MNLFNQSLDFLLKFIVAKVRAIWVLTCETIEWNQELDETTHLVRSWILLQELFVRVKLIAYARY